MLICKLAPSDYATGMVLGERILQRLNALGISKSNLADSIGITRGSVSHYLSGLRQPSVAMLTRLAEKLACSTDYLLGTTEQVRPAYREQEKAALGRTHDDVGKNILFVDDNLADLRLLEEALALCEIPANLHMVENAVQAFSFLANHPPYVHLPTPDLILMDLSMPVISGQEAIGIIHREPKWRDIPIFVLSSSGRQDDIDTSYRLGAELFIIKPSVFEHYIRLAEGIGEYLTYGKPIGSSTGIQVARRVD
jgi:two-component system, chemotaxis family, response regulator Rcp1